MNEGDADGEREGPAVDGLKAVSWNGKAIRGMKIRLTVGRPIKKSALQNHDGLGLVVGAADGEGQSPATLAARQMRRKARAL